MFIDETIVKQHVKDVGTKLATCMMQYSTLFRLQCSIHSNDQIHILDIGQLAIFLLQAICTSSNFRFEVMSKNLKSISLPPDPWQYILMGQALKTELGASNLKARASKYLFELQQLTRKVIRSFQFPDHISEGIRISQGNRVSKVYSFGMF